MRQFFAIFGLIAVALLTSCSPNHSPSSSPTDHSPNHLEQNDWQKDFPTHWWQEVPRKDAKSWEILPQDAGYMEVILSKRNELGLLSNFADMSFVYRGVCYPTVEAYWQMMKFPETQDDARWAWSKKWKYTRAEVSQMDGYKAKSAGSYANFLMEKNNTNWVTFEGQKLQFYSKKPGTHYDLIWNALVEKVRQNPEVFEVLLKTKDLTLRPDHKVEEDAPAEWHFYRLWMEIRSQIQSKKLNLETQEDLSLKTCKSN